MRGLGEPADNAVEAKEGFPVTVDGVRYRVSSFRQINPAHGARDAS